MIRVLLVDDQVLVRAGFRVLLQSDPEIEVVGEAGHGEEAVALVGRLTPDVVLMDIRMPGMDGLEATRRLASRPQAPRVLILTTFEADEYVFEALRAGASGFLLKDVEPEDLLKGIRVVAGGEALLSPSVTRRLIAEFAARPPQGPLPIETLAELTERERGILVEVASGRGNDEIAERLFLSPATVKTHVSRIMSKLDLHDRAQLVVIAYQTGLVAPGA